MLANILGVIYVVVCIAIIVLVLMQEGKSSGLSSTISGSSNSYWGKNKDRSIEGSVPKITGILAAVYFVFSIILNMI